MGNVKEYKIVINGLSESISQVDALNAQLNTLDAKIKELSSKSVTVTANTATDGGKRTSELSAEDKILKQIQQTEEKIAAVRSEAYSELLKQKAVLADVTAQAKERAASERLAANSYANTMQGVKQELADVKTVLQTTELGSEEFNNLISKADELTKKLKEIEQSYSVFGRNVGNYPQTMANDFIKFKIAVNGVTREFNSANEALKVLKRERNTLELMGQDIGDLGKVVKTLESDIKDMAVSSKAMDTMLDTMQGLVALGSTAKGLSSIFGFDNDAIDETIKKLLALQNALNGLEVIKRQMQTSEGIGGIISRGNAAIDSFTKRLFDFTKRLFGLQKNVVATNTALSSTSAAGKEAATGLGTASVAANKAAKSFSLASLTAAGLKVILNALGIGLVIGAISLLVTGINKLIEKQKEAKKYQEDLNNAIEDGKQTYAKANIEITSYQRKLDKFNGTKKQEKRLVEELNSKYGNALGQYKTLAEWQKILRERGAVYAQVLAKQAEAQALMNMYVEAYIRLEKAKQLVEKGPDFWDEAAEWLPWKWGGKSAKDKLNDNVKASEKALEDIKKRVIELNDEIEKLNKDNKMFDYSDQIDKNADKTKDAMRKAEESIIKLKLELMNDSLAKTLLQLKAERDARIAEVKKTGIAVAEQERLINALYEKKEIEARKAHYKTLLGIEEKYREELERVNSQSYVISNSRTKNENELANNKEFKNISGNTLTETKIQLESLIKDYNKYLDSIKEIPKEVSHTFEVASIKIREHKKYFKELAKEYEVVFKYEGKSIVDVMFPDGASEKLKKEVDEHIEQYNMLINAYDASSRIVDSNLVERYHARVKYYQNLLDASKAYYKKEADLQKSALDAEIKAERDAEKKRHSDFAGNNTFTKSLTNSYSDLLDTTIDENAIEEFVARAKAELDKWLQEQDEALQRGELSIEEYTKNTSGKLLESYRKNELDFKTYLDLMEQENETHQNKMTLINNKEIAQRERIDQEYKRNMKQINAEYYSNLQNEVSLQISAITRMRDKAEEKDAWEIINYNETKKKLKDFVNYAEYSLEEIGELKKKLVASLNSRDDKDKIEFADFDSAMSQLDALEAEINQTSESVQDDLKELGSKWWGEIDKWIQEVGQTMNQILGSVAEIQSNKYDKMIEEQEKYIDEYEKLLDKQRDITEKHASRIESIEDELATARGDRRQQLIDQLNAEIAAQRASLAQEKKMEKEQEKAEERKKKLEHDQAEGRKRMQLAQAIINAAMAVSMAAVNTWPIPAIPMMGMAAAAGAAQIAAIKSQHIPSYGDGGAIEGKSHRDGGVKARVGNNPIELEGGEFIIRKKSTMPNLGLLDYVNRSEKKLSLEDLIDFYTSKNGMRKKVMENSPRRKYADGGVIPSLRSDIDLNSKIFNALDDYANRPVVVSVVDIIDKTKNVNQVQAMAGLIE